MEIYYLCNQIAIIIVTMDEREVAFSYTLNLSR